METILNACMNVLLKSYASANDSTMFLLCVIILLLIVVIYLQYRQNRTLDDIKIKMSAGFKIDIKMNENKAEDPQPDPPQQTESPMQ